MRILSQKKPKAEDEVYLLKKSHEHKEEIEDNDRVESVPSDIGFYSYQTPPKKTSLRADSGVGITSPPHLERQGFLLTLVPGILPRENLEREFQEFALDAGLNSFSAETSEDQEDNSLSDEKVLNINKLFHSPSRDDTLKTLANSSVSISEKSVSLDDSDSNYVSFRIDQPEFQWFPLDISLSLISLRNEKKLKAPHSAGGLKFTSTKTLVQDAVLLHLERHCQYNIEDDPGLQDSKETSSIALGDYGQPSRLIKCFLSARNYEGAIAIIKALLLKIEGCNMTTLMLQRQLALLYLAASRPNEAIESSSVAVKKVPDIDVDVTMIVEVLLENGLVMLGSDKAGQAIQTLREALHICISEKGYENRLVSNLLNTIGIFHFHSGDIGSALYCFEESVELKQSLLGGDINPTGDGSVDEKMFSLGTAMCNLAEAFAKSSQADRALAILDEVFALFQSTQLDTGHIEDCIRQTADCILAEQQVKRQVKEKIQSLPRNSTDWLRVESMAQKETLDFSRSLMIFGNFDGIPCRRVSTKRLTLGPWDNANMLLLGPIEPELSAAQMVRQVVLSWIGKRLDDDEIFVFDHELCNLVSISATLNSSSHSSRETRKETFCGPLPVDLDDGGILHCDLHLGELFRQTYNSIKNQEFADALELFRRALYSHKRKYGEKHHLVGNTLHNMGIVYFVARKHQEALAVFQEAATVLSKTLGPKHISVQASKLQCALIHFGIGETVRARDCLEEIRDTISENFGCNHPALANVLNNLGVVSYELGDVETAICCFDITYQYYRQIATDHCISDDSVEKEFIDRNIASTMSNMAFVFFHEDEPENAIHFYKEALLILESHKEAEYEAEEIQKNINFIVHSTGVESEYVDGKIKRNAEGKGVSRWWDLRSLIVYLVEDFKSRMDER